MGSPMDETRTKPWFFKRNPASTLTGEWETMTYRIETESAYGIMGLPEPLNWKWLAGIGAGLAILGIGIAWYKRGTDVDYGNIPDDTSHKFLGGILVKHPADSHNGWHDPEDLSSVRKIGHGLNVVIPALVIGGAAYYLLSKKKDVNA